MGTGPGTVRSVPGGVWAGVFTCSGRDRDARGGPSSTDLLKWPLGPERGSRLMDAALWGRPRSAPGCSSGRPLSVPSLLQSKCLRSSKIHHVPPSVTVGGGGDRQVVWARGLGARSCVTARTRAPRQAGPCAVCHERMRRNMPPKNQGCPTRHGVCPHSDLGLRPLNCGKERAVSLSPCRPSRPG